MNTTLNDEKIIEALKNCYDPEIPVNIYDLGLVYKIDVKGKSVFILMSLTSPFCPVTDMLVEQVKSAVSTFSGAENVEVEITFDPPWDTSKMSESAKAQLGL